MKEEIQGIVKAISQLSPPFIPYELKKILAPLYALKNITAPPEINTLNNLVEAQSELYGIKAQIKDLREKQSSLAIKIIDIQNQLKGFESLKSSIEPILAPVNEYLRKHNLTPINLPINLQNKETKKKVERYLEHIKALIAQLEVKEELSLIDDLTMIRVDCSRESSVHYIQQLIEKIKTQADRLINVCTRIDSIIRHLLVNIPAAEAPKRRQLIKVALEKLKADIARKQTDTETFTDLDYFEKEKLIQQADKTSFNPNLIRFYSNNQSTSSASAWLPSYVLGASPKSQQSLFLDLLYEKNELALRKATLDLLNELLAPSSFNPLKTNMAEGASNLIKEARDLFGAVNQSLVSLLPDTAANTDFFDLLHTRTLLDLSVKKNKYILDTLGKVLAIKQNTPSSDQTTSLVKASDDNSDEGLDKDILVEHRALCLSFLKGLEVLDPLVIAQQEKTEADAKLQSLGSLESANERIAANDRRIENAIRRITELTPSSNVNNGDNPKIPLTCAAPIINETDKGIERPPSPMDDEDCFPSAVLRSSTGYFGKTAALNNATEIISNTPVSSPSPVAIPKMPVEQVQGSERAPIVVPKLIIESGPETIADPILEPRVLINPVTFSAQNDLSTVKGDIPSTSPTQPIVGASVTEEDMELPSPKIDRTTDLQSLMFWHQQNLAFLREGPEKVLRWYVDLYQEVESYIERNPACYRPYHLIHDINLGLEGTGGLSTIRSYIQLCSNPMEIERLLLFKPNFSIQPVDLLALLQNPPTGLKPLCLQYERLKTHYPIESALLLQAIQALSMTKRLIESPSTRQSALIPLLTEDPFYEPLRKHRGFLRVWELLEQFLNALIDVFRPQKESTYTQSSCFFKTKTIRLLQQAEYSITHEPTGL